MSVMIMIMINNIIIIITIVIVIVIVIVIIIIMSTYHTEKMIPITPVEMLSHDGVLEKRSSVAFLSTHHHVAPLCSSSV